MSACKAKVGNIDTIIAVSNLSNLYMVDIQNLKILDIK